MRATKETANKKLLALSWNIATEPKLYQQLAPNPYSTHALRIISKRFPDVNLADIVKAVALAEPEGKYGRNFRLLEATQQKKEIYRQKDVSIKINKLLDQYCKKYAKELRMLSKKLIYDRLLGVVFETADLKTIEQRFAQKQRLDFRLSIINSIENIKKPKVLKWPLLKMAFAMLSLMLIFYLIQKQTQSNIHPQRTTNQVLGAETQIKRSPVRLIIPEININANIQSVGVNTKGEMEAPSNTIDVGWFKFGSRPGEKGSAVIDGHFNGENGDSGVFANLNKLKKGDRLYVQDDKGIFIAFVVRESLIYDSGYSDDVFSRNDSTHLNLITCDGVWDENKKSYTKRLVVFADLVR